MLITIMVFVILIFLNLVSIYGALGNIAKNVQKQTDLKVAEAAFFNKKP
jgi:hypothetical protein